MGYLYVALFSYLCLSLWKLKLTVDEKKSLRVSLMVLSLLVKGCNISHRYTPLIVADLYIGDMFVGFFYHPYKSEINKSHLSSSKHNGLSQIIMVR